MSYLVDDARRVQPLRAAVLAVFALAVFAGCTREPADVPPGNHLYAHHCASCHGFSGTGDGPVAHALRTPPTDLTELTQRSGGRFDEAQIMAAIDGRRVIAAHGTREMPVWGAVFPERSSERSAGQSTADRRTAKLLAYLRSIQRP